MSTSRNASGEPAYNGSGAEIIGLDGKRASVQSQRTVFDLLLSEASNALLLSDLHNVLVEKTEINHFRFASEVRFATCLIVNQAISQERMDLWDQLEKLTGTPGSQFIIKHLQESFEPLLEGLYDAFSQYPDNSIVAGQVIERIVSYLVPRAHSSYTATRHASLMQGMINTTAENQTIAAARVIGLLLRKLRFEGNSFIQHRLESCLVRLDEVVTLEYRKLGVA